MRPEDVELYTHPGAASRCRDDGTFLLLLFFITTGERRGSVTMLTPTMGSREKILKISTRYSIHRSIHDDESIQPKTQVLLVHSDKAIYLLILRTVSELNGRLSRLVRRTDDLAFRSG